MQSNATVEHDKQNVAETKEEDGECPRLFWTCDNQGLVKKILALAFFNNMNAKA